MLTSIRIAAIALLAGVPTALPAAAQQELLPVVPASLSINSIRPGVIAPCPSEAPCEDIELILYGVGFEGSRGAVEVLWDGQALATTSLAEFPDSRLKALLPAAFRAAPSTAEVVVSRASNGSRESSAPVTVAVDQPPVCLGKGPACGTALGEIPTIQIVPVHTWYPFAAAPAGGLVRVENRDTETQFGRHTVTSTSFSPEYFQQIASNKIRADGRFNVTVATPPSVEEPVVGYLRVPETAAPGESIPFFCAAHNLMMVTPIGSLVVQ